MDVEGAQLMSVLSDILNQLLQLLMVLKSIVSLEESDVEIVLLFLG